MHRAKGAKLADLAALTRHVSANSSPPMPDTTPQPLGASLSLSDRDVIRYLAKGLTNKQIAALIRRSPHTVKDRVERIAAVLGVRTRTAIVAAAIRVGLI